MSAPPASAPGKSAAFGWIDFGFCAALLLLGALYLWDPRRWAAHVYIGGAQYGDAQFWWDGALHYAQGIVADNPNLLYRMGYAAFGGSIAAVFGPDYLVFHRILLGVFLGVAAGFYAQLLTLLGRIAAAAIVLALVFNPFTAEWIAVSSSDSLGMMLNLGAMLALGQALRRTLSFRWLAAGGALLAGGSLTRPLMTPLVIPALLAVASATGWRWRPAIRAGAVLLGPFVGLTLAWMGLMTVLTGQFTVSGVNQQSSIFYAASDPRIQVWNPTMIPDVEAAAARRMAPQPNTPAAVDREYWRRIRENYRRHAHYHFSRIGGHLLAVAGFTPRLATQVDRGFAGKRRAGQLVLAGLFTLSAAWRRRWARALAVAALGLAWALWPPGQAAVVLTLAGLGLVALARGNRLTFLWASYWWVGAATLYGVGGTSGPPLGTTTGLSALGYRLGFQFFFAADLLAIGALAALAGCPESVSRPAGSAARWAKNIGWLLGAALALLLLAGSAIVIRRGWERAHNAHVPYPDLTPLVRAWPELAPAGAKAALVPNHQRQDLKGYTGAPGARLLTTATSSGFIWNLAGQRRCMLLLYLQDDLKPARMAPWWILGEVSRQLPERPWMSRQGAWVIRPFRDLPDVSSSPYFYQVSSIQAFIPLAADGRSYDTSHATVFPLTKYASQLVAAKTLTFQGIAPIWVADSGAERFPRRFALRRNAGPAAFSLNLDLRPARGQKSLRFGWHLESAGSAPRRPAPPAALTLSDPAGGPPLWQASSRGTEPGVTWVELPADGHASLHLAAAHLLSDDTLWLYEFTLTADDFAE